MRFSSHQVAAAPIVAVLVLVLAAWLGQPLTARAESAEWPLEVPADVLVAFGGTYTGADGGPVTHRGVDLAAESGDRVLSPCAGVVRFVGSIPAVGLSGTQRALTIERDDGLRFTLMPLDSVCVPAGTRLEAGTSMGEVAGQGDASSADVHLHVGARRGELYVDPLEYLGAGSSTGGTPEAGTARTQQGPSSAAQPTTAEAAGRSEPRAASHAASVAEVASAARSRAPEPNTVARATSERESTVRTVIEIPDLRLARDTRTTGSRFGEAAGQQGAAAVGADSASAGSFRSSFEKLLTSVTNRSVPAAGRTLSRLVRAWFVATIALLAAAGALWPLWRRAESVEEPGPCVAPVGGEIAAAAGR